MDEQKGYPPSETGMAGTFGGDDCDLTERLASILLQKLTPEQLALIVAKQLLAAQRNKRSRTNVMSETEAPGLGFLRGNRPIRTDPEHAPTDLESLAANLKPEMTEILLYTLRAFRKHKWGKGAKAKNSAMEIMKGKLLAEWDATHQSYSGQAAFARHVGRREGVKERTLGDWIRGHKKTNRS